jgi:hypothetical protein
MTLLFKIQNAWNDIQCGYGNHRWGEYLCDYHGFYHLLYTRKCRHCGKMEASITPFKSRLHSAVTIEETSRILDESIEREKLRQQAGER